MAIDDNSYKKDRGGGEINRDEERQKEGKINRWRGKQTEKGEERERR